MRALPLLLLAACVPEPADTDTDVVPEPATWDSCFGDILVEGGGTGTGSDATPDYSPFSPTIGSHCSGTDHQDIAGVQRVVFLGDSVSVGTPPTPNHDFYRSRLTRDLVDVFGLVAPEEEWQHVDVGEGTSEVRESGDFASCAEWGARADDLMRRGTQIEDCFPEASLAKNTLVIMTMGGNDLQALTEGFVAGNSHDDLWAQTHAFMADMRDAVEYLKEPGRFPAGVSVIFTNLYEFTDATGDTSSCPASALVGLDEPVTDPEIGDMIVWAMEEFMSIAVDTDSDMLFLLEAFCGHGFHHDDPESRCYRGPEAELWFDGTCIHPNPTGHEVIADMFLDVIEE